MESTHPGLLHPGVILLAYHVVVLDIKVCFFQIPLVPIDRRRFAFTIWEPNMHKPAQRFQSTILPQGMKNSPKSASYVSQRP